MQETITLADGTVLDGHVLESDGRLYVYLNRSTLGAAFPVLNDPEKTAVVVARIYGQDTVYTGYDHLTAVTEEFGGMVSGVLKKS